MYERYCEIRDAKGLKDSDVARETGVNKSTFSDWKSGRSNPKIGKLKKIAEFLGVPTTQITGEDFELSESDALLDLRISNDLELRSAIEKYYSLSDKKKKHVIELIELLSEE